MKWLRNLGERLKSLVSRDEEAVPATVRVGRRGEKEAARYLKGRGYTILARNYRVKHGEMDLVAFRDGVLAFVEVRALTQPGLIDPLEGIGRRKQRRIIKTAQTYTSLNQPIPPDTVLRFDVITVLFDQRGRRQQINHLEGAFQESPKSFF